MYVRWNIMEVRCEKFTKRQKGKEILVGQKEFDLK